MTRCDRDFDPTLPVLYWYSSIVCGLLRYQLLICCRLHCCPGSFDLLHLSVHDRPSVIWSISRRLRTRLHLTFIVLHDISFSVYAILGGIRLIPFILYSDCPFLVDVFVHSDI